MNTLAKVVGSSAIIFLASLALRAAADADIEPVDFVEEASAKGIAEIETGKLALEKSSNPQVRAFAEKMIEDHTKANQELARIAQGKNLEVADDAELLNRIKTSLLSVRNDEAFDAAYAKNQVTAHEQTIELFERGAKSKDTELKAFAREKLPKLQAHLTEARKLVSATDEDARGAAGYRDVVPTRDRDPVAPGSQPAPGSQQTPARGQ